MKGTLSASTDYISNIFFYVGICMRTDPFCIRASLMFVLYNVKKDTFFTVQLVLGEKILSNLFVTILFGFKNGIQNLGSSRIIKSVLCSCDIFSKKSTSR